MHATRWFARMTLIALLAAVVVPFSGGAATRWEYRTVEPGIAGTPQDVLDAQTFARCAANVPNCEVIVDRETYAVASTETNIQIGFTSTAGTLTPDACPCAVVASDASGVLGVATFTGTLYNGALPTGTSSVEIVLHYDADGTCKNYYHHAAVEVDDSREEVCVSATAGVLAVNFYA